MLCENAHLRLFAYMICKKRLIYYQVNELWAHDYTLGRINTCRQHHLPGRLPFIFLSLFISSVSFPFLQSSATTVTCHFLPLYRILAAVESHPVHAAILAGVCAGSWWDEGQTWGSSFHRGEGQIWAFFSQQLLLTPWGRVLYTVILVFTIPLLVEFCSDCKLRAGGGVGDTIFNKLRICLHHVRNCDSFGWYFCVRVQNWFSRGDNTSESSWLKLVF